MRKTRTSYTPEEKMQIIIDVMSRKTSIQNISKEKGIAPTLISLWKKQAEDAILERFKSRTRGRRPKTVEAADKAPELRRMRNEARKARIKAAHLESSLKDTKARLASAREQMAALAETMGCKLVKNVRRRAGKA
ncbi:MAG TPA: transposase [Candidatus Akkermansia intestinigallinarum]|uniref:Transposase n=1 Tax=Candidatus Akkermansia intestinigallinarum TaxID=2838431 RepID=A0A9D2AHZ6_9BACT|nr:transposase [Candidatus Akkermansia intestinigallinarum]